MFNDPIKDFLKKKKKKNQLLPQTYTNEYCNQTDSHTRVWSYTRKRSLNNTSCLIYRLPRITIYHRTIIKFFFLEKATYLQAQ